MCGLLQWTMKGVSRRVVEDNENSAVATCRFKYCSSSIINEVPQCVDFSFYSRRAGVYISSLLPSCSVRVEMYLFLLLKGHKHNRNQHDSTRPQNGPVGSKVLRRGHPSQVIIIVGLIISLIIISVTFLYERVCSGLISTSSIPMPSLSSGPVPSTR